jgi:integrase
MKRRRRRGFGAGSIRRRGNRWQLAWREGGRRRYTVAPDEPTARRMLAKILSDVALGKVGLRPDPRDSPTLGEIAADWLDRRKMSHRSWDDDAGRWRLHLAPRFGKLRPDEVDQGAIRTAVDAMLADGLASATCQRVVRLLSTFYTDLVERGLAKTNPAKNLPKGTRRLLRSTHDPKTTPYVERIEDVRRIYLALPDPVNLAYAIGAMAGLRVGELLALRWANVDLEHRRIIVSEQVQDGEILPPKDKDARVVPIVDSLLPVLQAAKLASGGADQVLRPMRGGYRHLDPHTLGKSLRVVFEKLNKDAPTLPAMTWYQATRHTFASQWVLAGGSIEKLREAMGHSTVLVTERYCHLRGDVFTAADLGRVAVDFSEPGGKILPLVREGSDSAENGAKDTLEAPAAELA